MASDWIGSNGLRGVGYALVGLASLHAAFRERDEVHDRRKARAFWFLTAIVLFTLAIGVALEIYEPIIDFGRSRARLMGWYRSRRGLQAVVEGLVSAAWLGLVFVAVWRVPGRRRYLPMAVMLFTLVWFATVRLVSLHQVDAFLLWHRVGGVSVGTIVEWILIALAILAAYWRPIDRQAGRSRDIKDDIASTAGAAGVAGD